MRSTFAFNRDMTLQVFLQPFVASGDYTNIRRLARPLSFDFEPATPALQSGFQQQVDAQQRRAAMGVRPRQHALRGLEHVQVGRRRGRASSRRCGISATRSAAPARTCSW